MDKKQEERIKNTVAFWSFIILAVINFTTYYGNTNIGIISLGIAIWLLYKKKL